MKHAAFEGDLSPETLIAWYRRTRARTRELFDLIAEEAWLERPIALRNPIAFYEGHLPAFSVNTLVKLGQNRPGLDDHFETLFARGIDPEDEAAVPEAKGHWPSRAEVRDYASAADDLVARAIGDGPLVSDEVPALRRGEAVFTIIEHELMHQETLLYIFHELGDESKVSRGTSAATTTGARHDTRIRIPAGVATLGARRDEHFGWDNEFTRHAVDVPAFTIDSDNVTNGRYREFVEATGSAAPHFWKRDGDRWLLRGLLGSRPFDADAPVYVTHREAAEFARWDGGRLPTEAEYHRAAFGAPGGEERLYPWGDERPDDTRGVFGFSSWDPLPVGSRPAGASAWGVQDLVGNGWEWTSTLFEPFHGFEAMPSYPEYSADFFDGAHFVLKGASPVTPVELIRRSLRNWFRPNYPYVYATFRSVR